MFPAVICCGYCGHPDDFRTETNRNLNRFGIDATHRIVEGETAEEFRTRAAELLLQRAGNRHRRDEMVLEHHGGEAAFAGFFHQLPDGELPHGKRGPGMDMGVDKILQK